MRRLVESSTCKTHLPHTNKRMTRIGRRQESLSQSDSRRLKATCLCARGAEPSCRPLGSIVSRSSTRLLCTPAVAHTQPDTPLDPPARASGACPLAARRQRGCAVPIRRPSARGLAGVPTASRQDRSSCRSRCVSGTAVQRTQPHVGMGAARSTPSVAADAGHRHCIFSFW